MRWRIELVGVVVGADGGRTPYAPTSSRFTSTAPWFSLQWIPNAISISDPVQPISSFTSASAFMTSTVAMMPVNTGSGRVPCQQSMPPPSLAVVPSR
jgi:hypothetical protein